MTALTGRPASLFGSLNARQLSFEQVGRLFVAPDEFSQICQAGHHVLLGPRGSGKTTLLKMLTKAALAAQESEGRGNVLHPDFLAVYVPTDLLWARTLNQYWESAPSNDASGIVIRRLVQSIITHNILDAFITAVEMELTAENAPAQSKIVADLADSWSLQPKAHTIYRLREALLQRVSKISSWLELAATGPNQFAVTADSLGWLAADPIRLLTLGIDSTVEHLELSKEQRWALCFDELEIAPVWLREYVISSLRSTDQRLCFKLSASPMQQFSADELFPSSSQQLHDYTVVKLWHSATSDSRVFAEKLTQTFLSKRSSKFSDPEKVFGTSSFARDDEDHEDVYKPGSEFWRIVRELSKYDRGLADMLRRKQIGIENLGHFNQKTRDEVLRKLKPIVMLRYAFLRAPVGSGGKPIGRPRKGTRLYTGIEALYAVCDGNPRWLTGLLNEMWAKNRGGKVRRSVQAAVIASAAKRFLAMLAVLPESTQVIGGKPLTLPSVLDNVAKYFKSQIFKENFVLDPHGTFVVDSRTSDELVELIRMAASQGAVIHVDSENIDLNANPRGKRFRLSFLLAPAFRLPFRVYEPIALSRCLGDSMKSRVRSKSYEFMQAELFSAQGDR